MNEKEMCEAFAKNLKSILYKNDMTQNEFAKKIGVAKSSVSGWINAKYIPRTDVLENICSAFNVKLSDLVLEKNVSPKDTLTSLVAEMSDSQIAELETYARFLLRTQEEE